MGFPLYGGKYENGMIKCKEHGLKIDVKTGKVVDGPKVSFLKLNKHDLSVNTYKVIVENEKIYIDL